MVKEGKMKLKIVLSSDVSLLVQTDVSDRFGSMIQ